MKACSPIKPIFVLTVTSLLAYVPCLKGQDQADQNNIKSDNPAAATQPAATQPSITSEVLVYMGDFPAVTQADVDRLLRRYNPERYESLKDQVVFQLVKDRVWDLYLKEHPGFVTEKEVDEAVENVVKKLGLKSVNQLAEKMMKKSGGNIEDYRRRLRRKLVVGKIIEQAMEKTDEETIKQVFEANPEHFNATLVAARQIVKFVPPYKTEQQREAIRKKMEKIREDLVSGKRTWEECLQESDWGRKRGGKIGSFPRHRGLPEPVAEAAFSLEEGEISKVIESELGFHILQILDHKPGSEGLEKGTTRWQVRSWLQKKALLEARNTILDKYPIIGMRAPEMPDYMREQLAAAATRPAATQPATATQPAATKSAE